MISIWGTLSVTVSFLVYIKLRFKYNLVLAPTIVISASRPGERNEEEFYKNIEDAVNLGCQVRSPPFYWGIKE